MIVWNMNQIIEDAIASAFLLMVGLFYIGRAIYFEVKERHKNDKNKHNHERN